MALTIISGQNFPKEAGDKHGEVIDPFVRVKVFGLDGEEATFNTGVIKKNGFNPVWNHEITFKLANPEFAVIVFQVCTAIVMLPHMRGALDPLLSTCALIITGVRCRLLVGGGLHRALWMPRALAAIRI